MLFDIPKLKKTENYVSIIMFLISKNNYHATSERNCYTSRIFVKFEQSKKQRSTVKLFKLKESTRRFSIIYIRTL